MNSQSLMERIWQSKELNLGFPRPGYYCSLEVVVTHQKQAGDIKEY